MVRRPLVRPLTMIIVALLIVGASSCRREDNTVPDSEEQDRILQSAVRIDDDTLLLAWDPAPCETFDRVEVESDDDYVNIEIKVIVDVADCPPTGIDETTIELDRPLGDRQIFDRAFGDTIDLGIQNRAVQTATRAGDNAVVLTWEPEPCESFERVDTQIDDRFVSVLVRVMVDMAICPDPGPNETTVELDEPIGDRQLYDLAVNETVPLQ